MSDREYREPGENESLWDGQIPEAPQRIPQVTLYADRYNHFASNYRVLAAFACRVCGVPIEQLCIADMSRFEHELSRLRAVSP